MKKYLIGKKLTRLPYLVFLIGLSFTMTFYWQLERKVERNNELLFSDQVRQIEFTMTHYLNAYREVLYGLQAFLQHCKQDISREDFHNYLQNFKTNENYSSFRSIAFLRRVTEENYDQVLNQLKTEKKLLYPDFFELDPKTKQKRLIQDKTSEKIIFEYPEPSNPMEQKAIGFNVLSEPKRAAAIMHARLVNVPTATAPLVFVYDKKQENLNNAFLIFLPVYKNKVLLGMVGAGFNVNKLFDRIFTQQPALKKVSLRITDIGSYYNSRKETIPTIIFNNNSDNIGTGLHQQFTITFAERKWQIDVTELTPSNEKFNASIPIILLMVGTIISLILAFISFIIVRELNRNNALLAETQKKYIASLEAESTLNSVINSLDQVIWLMSTHRPHYLFISPAAERLFAKPLEYMYTHPNFLFEMIHPNDKERIIPQAFSSSNLHKNQELTYRILLDDGTIKWITESRQVVYDDSGIEHYIGKINDITLQKTIENRFSFEQYDQFTYFLQQSQDAIFILEHDRLTECNTAFTVLVGKKRQHIMNQSLIEFTLKSSVTLDRLKIRYDDLLAQTIQKGHLRFDWTFLSAGQEIPCDVSLTKISSQPNKHYLIGICRDMRTTKQNFNLLKQNADEYRNIFNIIPESLFIRDSESLEIIEVNEQACQMYGYSAPEWMHLTLKKMSALHSKEDFSRAEAVLQSALNGQPQQFEWLARKKNNNTFHVEINVNRIEIRNKICLLFVVRDISRQKYVEKTLQQAKEMAEQANRAKTHFLANMSYDLRKPLHAILGMADLLSHKNMNEEQTEFNNIIKESGNNLLKMISNILEFTQIDAGDIEFSFTCFSLQDFMNEIMDRYTQLASEKNIRLQYIYAPTVPTNIYSDLKRLQQILQNLIENALKFTTEGHITISLDIQCKQENSQLQKTDLHFIISDTGVGIEKEQLENINNFFKQGEKTTQYTYGGINLGLAITTQLVQLMQGKIWVESTPRQGSHFHFTMPCRTTDPGKTFFL